MNFIAIDFETANNWAVSACSVGIVKVVDSQIVESRACLIKPGVSNWLYTSVHGLSAESVKNAPAFPEVWEKLIGFFDRADFIAAHNASFDRRVLTSCCDYWGLTAPLLPWECSLKLARKKLDLPSYNLAAVSQYLGIELKHHQAQSDALACAEIMIALS